MLISRILGYGHISLLGYDAMLWHQAWFINRPEILKHDVEEGSPKPITATVVTPSRTLHPESCWSLEQCLEPVQAEKGWLISPDGLLALRAYLLEMQWRTTKLFLRKDLAGFTGLGTLPWRWLLDLNYLWKQVAIFVWFGSELISLLDLS